MRILRLWLPVVVWAAIILSAANDRFSSEHSDTLFYRLVGIHLPYALHVVVRKTAHILEYSILAWLAWRAHRTIHIPLGIVFVVSSIDEWLQSHTRARTGTPFDMVLDCCAALLVLALLRSRNSAAMIPPP